MLGQYSIGNIPGNASEADGLSSIVLNQAGRNFQMAFFTVLARNLPFDENITLAGPIDFVKGLQGNTGIVFRHEFPEIVSLDLAALITENPAKGIVEKPEISAQIDLINPIGHSFNEHPVAIGLNPGVFIGRFGVFF
jgi:hypothetical protein